MGGVRPVFGQCVQSEVGGKVAPDRMGVVGVPLGVVVLDENAGPLDPLVVRLAGVGAPRPGELDLIEHRVGLIAGGVGPGQVPRSPAGVHSE